MTTTVVLTTYNGMKYIEPLLDSLRLQTQRIDEVRIYDDRSTDETVLFINDYIQKYGLNNWHVSINKSNKGWKQNFRDGMLAAEGELVFPCDQDDIWELNKIEMMAKQFITNDKMVLLSSDYTPLYECGGVKVDSFSEISDKPVWIIDNEKFSVHKRPGCVMCVRRSFLEKIYDIWEPNFAHDAFLWTAATLCGGNYLLKYPLIQYRRHDSNASTGKNRTVENQVQLMNMEDKIARWYCNIENEIPDKKRKMIQRYRQWCKLRTDLLLKHKYINFIKLIGYRKFFRSYRQELGDLYYIIFLNEKFN